MDSDFVLARRMIHELLDDYIDPVLLDQMIVLDFYVYDLFRKKLTMMLIISVIILTVILW